MQGCSGGSSRFSGQTRLMQQPELVKTRSAMAAAELERQRSSERKETSGRRRMGRPRSRLFIRKGRLRWHKKRGDKNYYPAALTPRSSEHSIKTEIH